MGVVYESGRGWVYADRETAVVGQYRSVDVQASARRGLSRFRILDLAASGGSMIGQKPNLR